MTGKVWGRTFAILLLSAVFTGLLTSAVRSLGPASPAAVVAVVTQHNDVSRTGANLSESILSPANVTVTQFGKLFTRTVDGQIYAQPLYIPNLSIPGKGTSNVVYVATMHNSIYAFDADDPAATDPLWQKNLGPSAPLPSPDIGPNLYLDISVEVGTLSTPVIDQNSNTLYAVAFNKDSPSACTITCTYNYRLHALDLTTGAEKFGGPVVITGTYPGCGWDNSFCVLTFNPPLQIQRTGLLLSKGVVYFGFGSFGDRATYHGWVFGYDAATLQRVSLFNTTPNGGFGGIWQSGQGLATDPQGYLYFTTGNGTFTNTGTLDLGDSFVKLDPAQVTDGRLPAVDWFTPYNQDYLATNDIDLGSAGPLLIPGTELLLGGGKEGKLYLLNRNNMGHYNGPGGPDNVVQSFQVTNNDPQINTGHIHGSPVYWNNPGGPLFYVWGEGDALKAFRLTVHNPVSATILTTPVATGTTMLDPYFMPGGILSISANGSAAGSGIVWASHPMTNANEAISRGVLRAYDASNVGIELWNSTQNLARDDVGDYAKFNPPTVVNGKVYLGTFSHVLNVYGLLAPSILTQPISQTINVGQSVTVSVKATGQGPLTYQWYRGTSGDASHPIAGATARTYTTSTLQGTTSLWARVSNSAGKADSIEAQVVVKRWIYLPVLARSTP